MTSAARRAFADRGWARTTLKEIATDAGVAEPTVYAIFGGKAGLAMALLEVIDDAADVERLMGDLGRPGAAARDDIFAVAAFERRMYEGAGDLIRMLHDGARVDDDLAAAYRDGVSRSDAGWRRVISRWPAGSLRPGIDIEHAVSVALVLCGIETFDVLHRDRGWSLDELEAWCGEALARELLAAGG